jgi:hypothetical protein
VGSIRVGAPIHTREEVEKMRRVCEGSRRAGDERGEGGGAVGLREGKDLRRVRPVRRCGRVSRVKEEQRPPE